MVSFDGGRIQMRPAASEGAESERTSHWRDRRSRPWRPIKAWCTRPTRPRCASLFLDLKQTMEIVRGLGHALPVGLSFEGQTRDEEAEQEPAVAKTRGRSRAARPGRPAPGPKCAGEPGVQRRLRTDGASGGLGAELLRGRSAGLPGRRSAGQLDDPAAALLHVRAGPRFRACPELCVCGGVRWS